MPEVKGKRDGRFSIAPVFRAHLRGLRSTKTQRFEWSTGVWLVSVPVALGTFFAVLTGLGLQMRDGVSQALAAVALLVGAMLSLFVFITNLRVKVQESATYAFRAPLQRLLGSAAASSLYVAVGALVIAGLLVLVASIEVLRNEGVVPYTVGFVVAAATHLVMTLLSLIRRLFSVYYELFASDFDPIIKTTPPAVDGKNEVVDRSGRSRKSSH